MMDRSESRLGRRSYMPFRRLGSETNDASRRGVRANRRLTRHLSPPTGSRQRAFTLIEILAAFVVFALAFGAVMQALSGSIRNTVQSRGYTQAALMARSHMAALGMTPESELEPGTYSGDLDEDYRYEMEIREWQPPEGGGPDGNIQARVELYRVDLKVRWGEEPRVRQATFSTLRAVSPER